MNGMQFVMEIFIQDTARMVNRLIYLSILDSPYICNTFAGPELGQRFLNDSTWRWGYGTFAIITPFLCIPFCAIFYAMSRKARERGVIRKEKSARKVVQTMSYWTIEFDGEGQSKLSTFWTTRLTRFSHWSTAPLLWLLSLLIAFWSHGIPERRLGFATHDLHDRLRICAHCRLHTVGETVGAQAFLPVLLDEGSLSRWGMFSWLQHMDRILVSTCPPVPLMTTD
jgi:hypothetical protein